MCRFVIFFVVSIMTLLIILVILNVQVLWKKKEYKSIDENL